VFSLQEARAHCAGGVGGQSSSAIAPEQTADADLTLADQIPEI